MPNDPNLTDDGFDDGTDGDSIVRLPRKDIRALEKKGKAHDEVLAKNQQLERDLAFARAGIDTSTDDGAFFARGYDGELTTEAIKATATKFGVLGGGSGGGQSTEDSGNGTGGDGNQQPQGQGGQNANPNQRQQAADADAKLDPAEQQLHQDRQQLHTGAAGDQGLDTDPFTAAAELGQKVLANGGRFDQAFGTALNSLVNAAEAGDQRVIIPSRSKQAIGAPLGS